MIRDLMSGAATPEDFGQESSEGPWIVFDSENGQAFGPFASHDEAFEYACSISTAAAPDPSLEPDAGLLIVEMAKPEAGGGW